MHIATYFVWIKSRFFSIVIWFITCKDKFVAAISANIDNGWVRWAMVNPLPKDKILDRSKLKAFADDKIK